MTFAFGIATKKTSSIIIITTKTDDDLNTTTSDIDSQPATPSSQADPNEEVGQPIYTRDGLFKIPRDRCDSQASQSEQEYIIARQTRSKVSLAETPIEAIEQTFQAPDVPLDLYYNDPHLDPDYFRFLFGPSDMDIDEDADPDYHPRHMDEHPSKAF